jgi:hypothetical protein
MLLSVVWWKFADKEHTTLTFKVKSARQAASSQTAQQNIQDDSTLHKLYL